MLKKTLVAAAVATVSLPHYAAAQAPDTRPQSPPPAPDGTPKTPSTNLGAIRVEGGPDEEGLKAETQTTSSKLNLTLRETPQSVTVITLDSLKLRQVSDFGQALELSAGVTQYSGVGPFGGQAGFGFNETTIRGIPIDSLNDVREDGFINSTYFAIPDMAIYDRVEVIKGPNSVTYGRGSAGGLINRIRKKPTEETLSEVALTVGSFDTYRADIDLGGALTSSGNVKGRFVGAYEDEGSFVDGVEGGRTVLAPSVQVDFTPDTRLLFEGLYQRDNYIPNPGMPLQAEGNNRFRAPDVSRSLFFGVPNVYDNRWNIYTGTIQLEQSLSDTWLATLRFNKNKTESPIQQDRYAYGLSPAGDTALLRNEYDIDRDIWAGELRISGEMEIAGKPVKIATGLEVIDNDYHRDGKFVALGFANIYQGNFADAPDAPVAPSFEFATRDKSRGAYLQAQVRPVERLSVLMGLRYDSTDSIYRNITGDTVDRKDNSDVTGRIGLTWDLTSQMSVYGVYAQSFSPVISSFDQNNNILDPETGEIFEVGLKTEWFDNRLGLNTAVYRVDREDMPVSADVLPGGRPYSVSAGLQRSEGFEVEVNGQPLPGWNLSAAYNRVDSEFKDPRDQFFGQIPGGSSKWQVGLFSSYEIQSGALQGFGFGTTVFSVGDRGLSTFSQGVIDGYTRVDLNLFYKGLPSYDFALSVRNVFDERYIEGADRAGAIAFFGSPTAFLLTMRHNFGN